MSLENPTASEVESGLHEIRINSMVKAIMSQRETASNQVAKLLSDAAVADARIEGLSASLEAAKNQAANLLSSNNILSGRTIFLEDQLASVKKELAAYTVLLENATHESETLLLSTSTKDIVVNSTGSTVETTQLPSVN